MLGAKLVVAAVTFTIGLAAIGCSSSSDATTGDDQNVTGTRAAKIGQKCGGNGDDPVRCIAGLTCFEPSDLELGTCVKKVAKLGEKCGGNGDHPNPCEFGLTCFEPSDVELGKCVKKVAKLGEKCGGNGDHPNPCEFGLRCDEPSDLDLGTCVKE